MTRLLSTGGFWIACCSKSRPLKSKVVSGWGKSAKSVLPERSKGYSSLRDEPRAAGSSGFARRLGSRTSWYWNSPMSAMLILMRLLRGRMFLFLGYSVVGFVSRRLSAHVLCFVICICGKVSCV